MQKFVKKAHTAAIYLSGLFSPTARLPMQGLSSSER